MAHDHGSIRHIIFPPKRNVSFIGFSHLWFHSAVPGINFNFIQVKTLVEPVVGLREGIW